MLQHQRKFPVFFYIFLLATRDRSAAFAFRFVALGVVLIYLSVCYNAFPFQKVFFLSLTSIYIRLQTFARYVLIDVGNIVGDGSQSVIKNI